ncbi:MAG TPA: Rieske (2Fe-2S) protein, partial [Candidatus Kryptonia bacterium]|nr:Rieske (2Fe-2S) protein [Candidatus Kryptonia bacterium]
CARARRESRDASPALDAPALNSMARVRIGNVADFPDQRGVAVSVGSLRLAVFRLGPAVFAVEDACSHRGFPLNDGSIVSGSVRCRTHGSCFNLRTGAVERGPAARAIVAYPAEIVGDQIEIALPD